MSEDREPGPNPAVAIVGVGAILPDAPDVQAFWTNVKEGRYSIIETPPERWDPELYFDPDPKAPDKTYSKIGGWVREGTWEWDPMSWKLPIPPRVGEAMDESQKWAVACTRAVLLDYGYPSRPLDPERTAVILGNAMAGEKHYLTVLRIMFPEFAEELRDSPNFRALPNDVQASILAEAHTAIGKRFPEITEDTMPGELGNILAGRVANLFNFRGPNYVTDAACASGLAAMSAAAGGLVRGEYDAVVTGGVDRNMGIGAFVKFCKIGALSATGTRPYADGADGFVMGEGASVFLLKRLLDAERDGDTVYAVVRAIGGSSDGKGKGITAPNPVGQRLAVERAWAQAGESPATATLVEGHGTSTRVGDVVEVQALSEVFGGAGAAAGSIALGSVKSNFGHLKSAAGAAGLMKTVLALHDKVLPPSINFVRPNPDVDFAATPFTVNTELREWTVPAGSVRRAGVSAFGFGGTNFHVVLEEHVPGRLTGNGKKVVVVPAVVSDAVVEGSSSDLTISELPEPKRPLRGALVIGADSVGALTQRIEAQAADAAAGRVPPVAVPAAKDLAAPERIAVDYADAEDLTAKLAQASKALAADNAGMWKALRARGIFRGTGPVPKVAFLYTGQGSQYANMLRGLSAAESIVAEVFEEADRIMAPLLGRPLSDYLFVDRDDPAAMAQAEEDLRQTAITQPAVLATDLALTKLLAAYGIEPDLVMGHSLGEYGALVAAGALTFEAALEAVSARGREMTRIAVEDNGWMAAVFAPLAEIERIVGSIDGYVVVANINSTSQAVIGGASAAVEKAIAAFLDAGHQAMRIPVSHAFHTSIVAPASEPLREALIRLDLQPPRLPIVANVTGDLYPMGPDVVPEMLDILARQVASPVQFVKGLHTLYEAGARVFVEVGPKKALQGFVDDVLAGHPDVASLFTNHPKVGDVASFNQALCGMYAAGLGAGVAEGPSAPASTVARESTVDVAASTEPAPERDVQAGRDEPVAITGAALGLPGTPSIFDDANVGRILAGEQFIDVLPSRFRQAMLDKHVTRLVKRADGDPTFEQIDRAEDVIKLAARAGRFDLEQEFGVAAERIPALDRTTQLAVGAGIDALRDAGIPMVQHYKSTTVGTYLPDRWELPEALRDDTGVIFASAFPGYDSFAGYLKAYHEDRARRERLADMESLRARLTETDGGGVLGAELDRRIHDLSAEVERKAFAFDRRFLFKALPMGHAQFAEIIGARGPNTQINSACASTTQAVAMAEDWIRAGRCRRVVVISADDATSDMLMEWIGAGFLASGAAATDENVEDAATPFDRRRHGMIIGMGAAALVVERADDARSRGIRPIAQVLGAVTANSAFHGSRLDVHHISGVMERLVSEAETRWGISRAEIAAQTVFVSHETYTPARGGSAAAEVEALRAVFGDGADRIVVANTKGFTAHPMGVGIEDIVAVKALETGVVPPVPNFKEVDPSLGSLNLSKGGVYPVRYALRLAAGFGSQISMTLLRWVPSPDGSHRAADELGFEYRVDDPERWGSWLRTVSGYAEPTLEVSQRRLRVHDQGPPSNGHAVVQEAPAAEVAPPPIAPVEDIAPPAEPIIEDTAPAAPSSVDAAGLQDAVLSLVSEKTGYPQDMLDLDLDLEADLGVDTVKQAEIFATVRETYGIPRDDTLKLRDFPTLAHVIGFIENRAPVLADLAPVRESDPPIGEIPLVAAALAPAAVDPKEIERAVLSLVAEKTGYPQDMLDLDLDLEADLGVDTVKQAEIFAALRESYGIARDDTLKLRDFPTLAHVMHFVRDRAPKPAVEPSASTEAVPVAETSPPEPKVAPQAPAATSPPPSALDPIEVERAVLSLVAEKTGYPEDMLDLDLDLEADLGVDTVKQAEIFATVREIYAIPRDDTLKLHDFPTVAHVMQFVRDRAGAATTAPQAQLVEAADPRPARPALGFEAANEVPRRVPVPVLRPPIVQSKPTGVRLAAGDQVLILADRGGTAERLAARLQELGAEAIVIGDHPQSEELEARLEASKASGAFKGVYWLPALDAEAPVADLTVDEWREGLRTRVKLLATAMRSLYDRVAPAGTFLVTATRMGGFHGYGDDGATAPMGGAVAGFTKAYRRERPDALVKVVDVEADACADDVAGALIEEALSDPGTVEVGRHGGLRWAIGLDRRPPGEADPAFEIGADTVFVVTGGAGSIVSAIVEDLAVASGGTFHLLDLAPEPDPADPDLRRFTTDRDGLKRDLFDRIKARGERATPALVEKELARLERAHAAVAAMEAVRAQGGAAVYHQVDLTDATAVQNVVDAIGAAHGRIDVLVHAAGLEISHFLPDKPAREFDLVFDVKSDGLFNLLHAARDLPLGAVVGFSSVAGRFGNAGQTDYSAANDLLCSHLSNLRRSRPGTRGIAIDWTAWAGIGMASRGSIPKMMELAGIDMLPPEAGIPVVRRELVTGFEGEVVIGDRLGVLMDEWHPTGGYDVAAAAAVSGPITGTVESFGVYGGLAMRTTLDPAEQPFLDHHRIDGTPVLPGVMGIEAFAELASLPMPGWHVAAVEDVEFLAPFKFYRDERRELELFATFRPDGDEVVAECRLLGSRRLPNRPDLQVTLCFTGRVRLARGEPKERGRRSAEAVTPRGPAIRAEDIYRVYFHGPAYRVAGSVRPTATGAIGLFATDLPPNHRPESARTQMAPRLIELCFQTAGVWELSTRDRYALPSSVGRVRAIEPPRGAILTATVTANGDGSEFDAEVVGQDGTVYVILEGYRTVELPGAAEAQDLSAFKAAME